MCVWERERELLLRHTESEIKRETERQRERASETERDSEHERESKCVCVWLDEICCQTMFAQEIRPNPR